MPGCTVKDTEPPVVQNDALLDPATEFRMTVAPVGKLFDYRIELKWPAFTNRANRVLQVSLETDVEDGKRVWKEVLKEEMQSPIGHYEVTTRSAGLVAYRLLESGPSYTALHQQIRNGEVPKDCFHLTQSGRPLEYWQIRCGRFSVAVTGEGIITLQPYHRPTASAIRYDIDRLFGMQKRIIFETPTEIHTGNNVRTGADEVTTVPRSVSLVMGKLDTDLTVRSRWFSKEMDKSGTAIEHPFDRYPDVSIQVAQKTEHALNIEFLGGPGGATARGLIENGDDLTLWVGGEKLADGFDGVYREKTGGLFAVSKLGTMVRLRQTERGTFEASYLDGYENWSHAKYENNRLTGQTDREEPFDGEKVGEESNLPEPLKQISASLRLERELRLRLRKKGIEFRVDWPNLWRPIDYGSVAVCLEQLSAQPDNALSSIKKYGYHRLTVSTTEHVRSDGIKSGVVLIDKEPKAVEIFTLSDIKGCQPAVHHLIHYRDFP